MGMKTYRSVFQKLMEDIIRDCQLSCEVFYIDDITIFSLNMEKNLVDEVFSKLYKAELKLNVNKCEFVKEKIKVLGHIISKNVILPDPAKITSIKICLL